MITTTALEASNRARSERPLVVVVTRRRSAASDATVRAITTAAQALAVETLALDVDDPGNTALLDELRVEHVPEVLVLQRGVLLERGGARDARDAETLLAMALRRRPNSQPPQAAE